MKGHRWNRWHRWTYTYGTRVRFRHCRPCDRWEARILNRWVQGRPAWMVR